MDPNATDEHPRHGTGNITVPNQERGGRYGSVRFTGELLGQPEWTRNMDLNPRVYFIIDHSVKTLPQTALPRAPQRPFGRFAETDSAASYTNTCTPHELTRFSAPTGLGAVRACLTAGWVTYGLWLRRLRRAGVRAPQRQSSNSPLCRVIDADPDSTVLLLDREDCERTISGWSRRFTRVDVEQTAVATATQSVLGDPPIGHPAALMGTEVRQSAYTSSESERCNLHSVDQNPPNHAFANLPRAGNVMKRHRAGLSRISQTFC